MAASLGYITALWCFLHHTWWTNVMIKFLSSTIMQSSSSTQSLDRHTQMLRFKIVLTELRTSFDSTWKMRIRGSLFTHSRTQETTSSIWTKRYNSCIQNSFWRSRRSWNLHASPVIWSLGQHLYQRCFKESFTKVLKRTHRPQHSNSWTKTIFLLCPTNRFLCGQHDFPQLLEESVYGHISFGSIAYVLDFCGIYFSCFLFIKLIVDLILMILRHMEINRLTGASLGFDKTFQALLRIPFWRLF